jgi:hypothetical protein
MYSLSKKTRIYNHHLYEFTLEISVTNLYSSYYNPQIGVLSKSAKKNRVNNNRIHDIDKNPMGRAARLLQPWRSKTISVFLVFSAKKTVFLTKFKLFKSADQFLANQI